MDTKDVSRSLALLWKGLKIQWFPSRLARKRSHPKIPILVKLHVNAEHIRVSDEQFFFSAEISERVKSALKAIALFRFF